MSHVVTAATPAEYRAACRGLFAHLPDDERERRADRVLRMIDVGEIDPGGLLVATRSGRVVGSTLIQFLPGAAAVVSIPGGGVADGLALEAVARLRTAGVKQAQAVVPPTDAGRAGPLLRAGFRHVTQLAFFCRPVPGPPVPRPTDELLAFVPVAEPGAAFAGLLHATYDGTLDCPELNGARSPSEVLTGYAAKDGKPTWWRVERGGEPVGVVILVGGAQAGVTELSYLGLVPAARGRRLGRILLRFALAQVEAAGSEWLTLSADVRNAPALRLYRGHDFRQYDLQHVFLWTP